MRHHRKGKKFGRIRSQRKALIRNLAFAVFKHDRIITTEARAKELRPFVEKLITIARRGTPESLRLITSRIPKEAARRLVKEIVPRVLKRQGGYMRITKLGRRPGDASSQVLIEFVS